MRKKLLTGLGVVAAMILIFVVVVALQPADYSVTRSATIAAPREIVFEQVNNLRKWHDWSPWEKLDPNAKIAFEGPPAGTGAVSTWDGNNEMGAGKMTIIESRVPELVRIKLDFVRPFRDTSMTHFNFKPDGNQTQVTWSMSGQKNFIAKAVCMFMDMDTMLGGQFEEGLAGIKRVAEAAKP